MTVALHQRQVIRHVVRALLFGNTAADERVVASRMLPYRKNELPAISVYTVEETVDKESASTAPREYTRDLKLEIAGWVAPGPNVDDDMDALALEIETLVELDPYFGGAVGDSILESTALAIRGEGDQLMGLVTLTYAVTYRTLAPEAPTLVDDFLRVDSKQKLANLGPDDDVAEDTFNVRGP